MKRSIKLAAGPSVLAPGKEAGLPFQTDTVVIAILPSEGMGGGIEAYSASVLQAIEATHPVERLIFRSGAIAGGRKAQRARFAADVWRCGFRHRRLRTTQVLVVSFHPSMIPMAMLIGIAAGKRRTKWASIFHGADIWNASGVRHRLWPYVVKNAVVVSSYGAAWLSALGLPSVSVLSPTVSEDRYAALLALPSIRPEREPFRVLSVFRLESFEEKGGRALVEAADSLRSEGLNVELVFAGIAPPSDEAGQALTSATRGRTWVRVVESVSDSKLIDLYGEADVFVLATRPSHGEGFGIVLAEAALAALPTVPPVSGGVTDAFVEGWTGIRPVDDSTYALTETLRTLYKNAELRSTLGQHGRDWAAWRFDPIRYAEQVRRGLLWRIR